MKYNPLKTDIKKGKQQPVKGAFDKKPKATIFDGRNQPQTKKVTGQTRVVKVNQTPVQESPRQQAQQINTVDINAIVSNPLFYQRLLKDNKKLVNELSSDIREKVFQDNKEYIKKMVANSIKQETNKSLIEFKVNFADFIKEFMKRQLDVSMSTIDIDNLKNEIEQIKLNTTNPSIVTVSENNEKSVQMETMINELKNELNGLKGSIKEIKDNESRLESKFDTSINQINTERRESLTDLEGKLISC